MNERVTPDSCIFCRIVQGEASAHRVHEDERSLAFMDIAPVADGHTLVIPKAHCSNLLDAEEDDLRSVIAVSRRVARAIREALAPDGIGVYQLNGAAAGQTVFHYHMHLVPRVVGSDLRLHGRQPGDPNHLGATARKLAAAMAGA